MPRRGTTDLSDEEIISLLSMDSHPTEPEEPILENTDAGRFRFSDAAINILTERMLAEMRNQRNQPELTPIDPGPPINPVRPRSWVTEMEEDTLNEDRAFINSGSRNFEEEEEVFTDTRPPWSPNASLTTNSTGQIVWVNRAGRETQPPPRIDSGPSRPSGNPFENTTSSTSWLRISPARSNTVQYRPFNPYDDPYDRIPVNKVYQYEIKPYNESKYNKVLEEKLKKYKPILYKSGDGVDHYGFELTNTNTSAVLTSEIVIKDRVTGKLRKLKAPSKYVTPNVNALYTLCKVKLKSVDQSSKLFGFRNIKKKMLDESLTNKTTYDITSLSFNYECKKDKNTRDCIILKGTNGNVKFTLEDCEIIYPNINGIALTVNRTIKTGSLVRCINNKRSTLNRNQQLKVITVQRTQNRSDSFNDRRSGKTGKAHIKNVIIVEDSCGKQHKNYLQNFKLI